MDTDIEKFWQAVDGAVRTYLETKNVLAPPSHTLTPEQLDEHVTEAHNGVNNVMYDVIGDILARFQ